MKKQNIEYRDGATLLEAFCAYDSQKDKNKMKPTVLIFHAWDGRGEFVNQKAEALAELGYAGIALDIFGKGVLGQTKEEKSKLIEPFVKDRAKLRQRILAGFEFALGLPFVDRTRMGAIGFCFGGLFALDLARSGADVKGVVSFHGLFGAPVGLKNEKIKAKILALHGHDDPMVPPDQVLAFEKEMTEQKVDWQVHVYSNTMHAFTNPAAHDPDFGTVYMKDSDFRSWSAMKAFFEEIL